MNKNRIRARINRVLALLFVVMIASGCVLTTVTDWKGIYNSVTRMTELEDYLPRRWNQIDLLNARIRSLDNYLATALWKSEELGYLNSAFQYALGKRVISTGGAQMIALETGHLYDIEDVASAADKAREMLDLETLLPGTPFLFVYEHPVTYDEEAMFPEGYERMDFGREFADEYVSLMREGGADIIDSRDVLSASGYGWDELLFKTDQHWTTLSAILMAREIARAMAQRTGVALDAGLLDPQALESETCEKLFLGKYGQRVGTTLIDPDDITLYWPAYDTRITRDTYYLGERTRLTGAFRDAVIRWDRLERGEDGYNLDAYMNYGLTENYETFANPDAPRLRVLLLKDSYSAPIGAFLSLVASDVYAVDLRRVDKTLPQLAEEFNPDIIVVAYSQQMLRDAGYVFAD